MWLADDAALPPGRDGEVPARVLPDEEVPGREAEEPDADGGRALLPLLEAPDGREAPVLDGALPERLGGAPLRSAPEEDGGLGRLDGEAAGLGRLDEDEDEDEDAGGEEDGGLGRLDDDGGEEEEDGGPERLGGVLLPLRAGGELLEEELLLPFDEEDDPLEPLEELPEELPFDEEEPLDEDEELRPLPPRLWALSTGGETPSSGAAAAASCMWSDQRPARRTG